jgi:hypothetical protein
MQSRKWFVGTVWAVLFGLVLAALWYGGHAWHKRQDRDVRNRFRMLSDDTNAIEGQDCFDRIRVGMSSENTNAIMKECGYEMGGGSVLHGEAVLVFKRNKDEPLIGLIFGQDGRLKKKEQDSTMEYGPDGHLRLKEQDSTVKIDVEIHP